MFRQVIHSLLDTNDESSHLTHYSCSHLLLDEVELRGSGLNHPVLELDEIAGNLSLQRPPSVGASYLEEVCFVVGHWACLWPS